MIVGCPELLAVVTPLVADWRMPGGGLQNMMGGIEPMQVDLPEENDNEAAVEEAEEQSYLVDNPSLDLEATANM